MPVRRYHWSMDFDTVIDRRGTGSLKWDNRKNAPGLPDIIPLWVADMDFAAPPEVLAALRRRAEHPVVGYTNPPADYFPRLAAWYGSRYGMALEATDFVLGPAVMPMVAITLRAFTAPGDGVLIMPPVYYPFFEIVRDNDRTLVEVPLLNPGLGRWEMDFAGIEAAIGRQAAAGQPVRAFLLSSPHNPGGRVWTRAELERLDDIAARHGVLVLSDEIHSDIVFAPAAFTSLADHGFTNPDRIVLAGPNKTFNIAGLHICHAIVRDPARRQRLARAVAAAGFSQPNAFAVTAAHAAYGACGPWVDGLKDYLLGNFDRLEAFLAARLPGARSFRPEATYLAWVDCRELLARLGLKSEVELVRVLEEEGRVKVSHGSVFGAAGTGFVRINVACPRTQLDEGLERIAATVARLEARRG
jgi:cystathionine beta-lyase